MHRPALIGHRGSPSGAAATENTLLAVRAALDAGADGVEVDARVTADGVVVCSHDPHLTRVAAVAAVVSRTSWAALRRLELPCGQRTARLEEMVGALAGRGRLVVEAKPDRWPGQVHNDHRHPDHGHPGRRHPGRRHPEAVAEALAAVLQDAAAAVDLTVSSSDPDLLGHVGRALPAVRRALVTPATTPLPTALATAGSLGVAEVHAHVAAVLTTGPLAAVTAAHTAGLALVPWTVNLPHTAALLAAAGADGLITDRVPALHRSLGRTRDRSLQPA